ncbi:MAG: Dabb family protein [Rhizobiaceae bacterium]|nr:Dabb family protein [Rhizobiaceae bacterium]
MITHTCVFRLRHAGGSAEEAAFVAAALELAAIAGVRNLDVVRQTSPKAPYSHCLTMEFATQADYDSYMAHPDHVAFTRDRWDREVTAFMILDYEPLGRQPVPRPRPGAAPVAGRTTTGTSR